MQTPQHSDGAGEGADCQEAGHFGVFWGSPLYSFVYHSSTKELLGWT